MAYVACIGIGNPGAPRADATAPVVEVPKAKKKGAKTSAVKKKAAKDVEQWQKVLQSGWLLL